MLPPLFLERLPDIIPAEHITAVVQQFAGESPLTVRVNTLKVRRERLFEILREQGLSFAEVDGQPEALMLSVPETLNVSELDIVKDGLIYRQSFSSMLPVRILDPQPGESILDMCAAPGSKTTQIAARADNQASIIAVEAIKARFYKLKAVCSLLGAEQVVFKFIDARRFRSLELFPKILLDAPCSSEGRFRLTAPKSFAYWSPRKIKEMSHKQKGLILSASRLLAPGGTLVYSTCTFSPEENEEVIDWVLRKTGGTLRVAPIETAHVPSYPALTAWQKRTFDPQVKNCLRVLPDGLWEGFFVAKLVKES